MCPKGSMIESKSVCLTKQNDPKQNVNYNPSSTKVKYEPRGSMAENNNVYKLIRMLFYNIKC